MAPTRPLVTQQIEACHKITGIPKKDCVEITGKHNKAMRNKLWQTKRIFFATPQTVQSDLNSEDFPFRSIRLIVVDEAHKAKGKYAYTEVIQSIVNRNSIFRVLALSATPGRHINDVVEVVRNLLISHVEIRRETSIDVAPYVHKRQIKTEVIPLGGRLKEIRDEFVIIADKYVRRLYDCDAIHGAPNSLTKAFLFMQHRRYRESAANRHNSNDSQIMSDFSMAVSLFHALELLEKHGLRIFLNYFDDDTNVTRDKFFLAKDRALKIFIDKLRDEMGPNPFAINDESLPNGSIIEMPQNFDFGHPKFNILQKYLIEHFSNNQESQVIIFCEYRDSVLLLHRLLLQNRPLIKPKIIVGKSSNALGFRTVTEKQQKFAMQNFRDGIVNTLIATCVAEEGIDVGEVDLIICFDISTANPQRFVQRIGRTGRKREGRIIALVTEGLEQDTLKSVLANKDKTNQKIDNSNEIKKNLYKDAPRLVPMEFNPKCIEVVMNVGDKSNDTDHNDDDENDSKVAKQTKKKASEKLAKENKVSKKDKKALKGVRDVRDFFKKIDPSQADNFATTPQSNKNQDQNISDVINLDSDNDDNMIPPPPINTSSPIAGTSKSFANNPNKLQAQPPKPNILNQTNKGKRSTRSSSVLNKLLTFQKDLNAKKATNPKPKLVSIENLLNDAKLTSNRFIQRFILKMNPDLVKFKMDAAKILDNLKNRHGDTPLPPHFARLQNDVNRIEKIFNGRNHIQKYLSNYNHIKNYLECMRKSKSSAHASYQWCETEGFELEFEEYDNRVTGLKFALNILKRDLYTLPELLDDIPDESIFGGNNDEQISNSFDQFCYNSSIPKQFSVMSNIETPQTTFKTPHSINRVFDDSPFLISFQKSILKNSNSDDIMSRMSSTPQSSTSLAKSEANEKISSNLIFNLNTNIPEIANESSKTKSWSLKSTLKYFLLESLDDLFVDSPDITQINSTQSKYNIQPRKLFSPLRGSQATVTQILNNIEQSEGATPKSQTDKLSSIFESRTHKPEFDLGDLDDIFGSDDDMFADYEGESKSKVELPVSLEETQIFKADNDLIIEKIVPTVSKVSREKSSDLFDTSSCFGSSDTGKSHGICSGKFDNKCEIILEEEITDIYRPERITTPPTTAPPDEITSPSILFGRSRMARRINTQNTSSTTQNPSTTPNSITKNQIKSNFLNPSARVQLSINNQSPALSQIPAYLNRRKRIISSSESSDSESIENNPPHKFTSKPKRRRRLCEFIEDEAEASNSDSCEEFQTQTQDLLQDSMIDNTFVETNPEKMRAIYLKSVKNSVNNRLGLFKIPDAQKYRNITNIFSQMPEQDDTYAEQNDSFVVEEGAELDVEEELCPLERAEAILRERRKKKLKQKSEQKGISLENGTKRKVYLIEDSSDDEIRLDFR